MHRARRFPDPEFPEVPVTGLKLGDNGVFFNHGYVIIDLAGSAANIAYYQDSNEDQPQYTEALGAQARAAQ